uniref:Uncharacterized protein n=1 Tax=Panagrolaimus sp. ES5 TaxID=591445 RepID=A0AC34GX82_9BILA
MIKSSKEKKREKEYLLEKMKTFLVIFAVISVCYADDVSSTVTPQSTTPSPPQTPAPLNNTLTGTIKNTDAPMQKGIPVQKSQGVVLTLTTNNKTAILYVSTDSKNPQPNADNNNYAVACLSSNNYMAQIQIPSTVFTAPTTAASFLADTTGDTTIYISLIALSTEVAYTLEYKPLVIVPPATSPATTPTVPASPTTSSSTMLLPAFFNTALLIFLYNYFTFSN